jgi:hypothetical protein
MKMKLFINFVIIVACIFLVGLSNGFAQGGTIKGIVQSEDGTKLPGVTVYIEGTTISTVTNVYGGYSLSGIREGEVTVIAFLQGFLENKAIVMVEKGKTKMLNFTMKMAQLVEEITVTAEVPLLTVQDKISMLTLTPSQISKLPSLGEKDIFRAFQLLPGISGSNEASSGLYVRGGTPDQNLIMYDGFTIYHVDHLFGYFSTFNPEAVDYASLSKGGFESKYGGRLSSVMELKGKIGNEERISVGAGLSMLSFNSFVEIPFLNSGSVLIAGRRSFQSPLYQNILDMFSGSSLTPRAQSRPDGGMFGGGGGFAQFETQPKSYFYDLNAKLAYKLSSRDSVYLSYYKGKDDLDNSRNLEMPSFLLERLAERGIEIDSSNIDISDLTKWGNTGISTNWSREWNDAYLSSFTIAYSNYFNNRDRASQTNFFRNPDSDTVESSESNTSERGTNEDNYIKDITLRFDNEINIGTDNKLEFGAQITNNNIKYAYASNNPTPTRWATDTDDDEDDDDSITLESVLNRENEGKQYSFYLQDRWTLLNKLTVVPGIRATYYNQTEDMYYEPRLSLNFKTTDRIKLKAAWGKYYQFTNRVSREDIMQGNRDFWILSDDVIVPVASAIHYIAGTSYETEDFLLDIETYYKELSGLSEFSLRFSPALDDIAYEDYFFEGTGIAKGVEFLIQKKYGNYTGWASYTLGQIKYDFPDYGEEPFPASHDQTHEFKLVNIYRYNNWTFSGTWIYATGKPYTEPIGVEEVKLFNDFTVSQVVAGDKNAARLPNYHRLDLSASYDFKLGNSKSSVGLSIFNAYNRKNVWYREFDVVEDELIVNDIQYMGFTVNLFFSIIF